MTASLATSLLLRCKRRVPRHKAASLTASLLLRCKRRVPGAPSVPSLHSSLAASLIASRFSCVATGVCLWRRQPPRFACHMTASLIASLLLRRKRCVPVAPSVSLLRSSHDGVAHCFASLALQTACACGSIGPFASLVTRRRCSLLCLPCVAYRVCLWRRRTLRFACRMAVSLIASLLFVQSACACGAVGPFASLVT